MHSEGEYREESPFPDETENETISSAKKGMIKKYITVKTAFIVALVLIAGALAYTYKHLAVAAMVNGRPITRFAVLGMLEKSSGKQALESLITELIIEQETSKYTVAVTDEEVAEEIKKIEAQVSAQGGTLDMALASQGMTRDDLLKRIATQKKIEKILEDKVQVADAEIDQFIKENGVKIEKGKEAETRDQIKSQLKGQKFGSEANKWIDSLRTAASIRYFMDYK